MEELFNHDAISDIFEQQLVSMNHNPAKVDTRECVYEIMNLIEQELEYQVCKIVSDYIYDLDISDDDDDEEEDEELSH